MWSCNRMSGHHTGENILQSNEEIAPVSEFNILASQSDNASNMTKAFVTLPGFGDTDEVEEEIMKRTVLMMSNLLTKP